LTSKYLDHAFDGPTKSIRTLSQGSSSIKGLSVDQDTKATLVADVPTPIPAIPLTARNHISIHNTSVTDKLYIGKITVNTTTGWELDIGEKTNVDITDAILIYGVCAAGKSVIVKSWEVA